jgi:hypothetical protein
VETRDQELTLFSAVLVLTATLVVSSSAGRK